MKTIQEIQSEVDALNPQDIADYAWSLCDEFRLHFDAELLVSMLTSDSEKLLSIAAWIAGEVVDVTTGRMLRSPIAKLLSHPAPEIRVEVIKPAFVMATPSDHSVVARILELLADRDVSVRCRALRIACLMDDELISEKVLLKIPQAALMLPQCTKEKLQDELGNGGLMSVRICIAGIMKHFSADEELTKLARLRFADDLRVFDSLPKQGRYM
jgi:hypothetical protein